MNRTRRRKNRALAKKVLKSKANEASKNEKNFQCWCCLKKFKDESLRRQHMRLHDPSLQTFPCNPCFLLFPSKAAYNNHLKTEHKSSSESGMCEQEEVSPAEQTILSSQKINELRLNDEWNHSWKNYLGSCPDDPNLRIANTFSLKDLGGTMDTWPTKLADLNKTSKNINSDKNDVDFYDLTLDSEDEDCNGGGGGNGESEQELSIHDVILVEDDTDNEFNTSRWKSREK